VGGNPGGASHMTGRKLVQDESCHWYVIPADRAADWLKWEENAEEKDADGFPRGWTVPEFAIPIGGHPSNVTFNEDGTYSIT
jgi:hypothetical protein